MSHMLPCPHVAAPGKPAINVAKPLLCCCREVDGKKVVSRAWCCRQPWLRDRHWGLQADCADSDQHVHTLSTVLQRYLKKTGEVLAERVPVKAGDDQKD